MKPFKFTLSGEDYLGTEDNMMVCMFRKQPEIDYFKIEEEDQKLYVFNNPELARNIGGFTLSASVEMAYITNMEFRREYGFNAITVIEDSAREYELELYIDANTTDTEERPPWLN